MSMSRQLLISKYLEEKRQVVRPDKIRIRAFRACDDIASSARFHQGHTDVVASYGVKITSANPIWIEDRNCYVVLIESLDGNQAYGGARIQISSEEKFLPIESAIGYLEPKIHDEVKRLRPEGVAEICGLWNSSAVAGMGIGSLYSIRCAFATAGFLDIKHMYAFCSPYTYRMANRFGFLKDESFGNDGAIPYPNDKLISMVTYQSDVKEMLNAIEEERNIIFNLRKNPLQVFNEKTSDSQFIEVHYQLFLD